MDFMPGTQRFVFASAALISFITPQSSAEAQGGLAAQAATPLALRFELKADDLRHDCAIPVAPTA